MNYDCYARGGDHDGGHGDESGVNDGTLVVVLRRRFLNTVDASGWRMRDTF
jgi:hypothetical protein